jgi:hypothetical protein
MLAVNVEHLQPTRRPCRSTALHRRHRQKRIGEPAAPRGLRRSGTSESALLITPATEPVLRESTQPRWRELKTNRR